MRIKKHVFEFLRDNFVVVGWLAGGNGVYFTEGRGIIHSSRVWLDKTRD